MDPGALICVAVLLLVLPVAVMLGLDARVRRREALDSLAARLGGRVDGRALRFEVDGLAARLEEDTAPGEDGPSRTRVTIAWMDAPGALRLRPRPDGFPLRIHPPASLFQEAFAVEGDPGLAARLRLDALEEGLLGLRDLQLDVVVDATGVTITCERHLTSSHLLLWRFVEMCLDVLRALRPAPEHAPLSVREAVSAGRCPVCFDALPDAPYACGGCRTAYHPECWEYLGGCATLGCAARGRVGRERGW